MSGEVHACRIGRYVAPGVLEYFERVEPIPWVRVFEVPDHVYFSHRMHLRKDFDCPDCHGDVARMDRVKEPRVFEMGFCLDCHKPQGGPRDCMVCHR